MDEFIFRSQNALESLQVQLNMTVENGLRLGQQYINELRTLSVEALQHSKFDTLKESINKIWSNIVQTLAKIKNVIIDLSNSNIFTDQLKKYFHDDITRNNLCYIFIGLCIGATGGLLIGFWLAKPHRNILDMKSIACVSFHGPDNVTLCHTEVPQINNSSDILIRVRAVCINRIDEKIANGYGRTSRLMIQEKKKNYDNKELPLVIGRSCAGIIEGIGNDSKTDLLIGDEVWLASHWYDSGLASEFIITTDNQIGRKPHIIGFEAAASLPYSGCIALNAFIAAGLNEFNCDGKKILIQDGCSPVGCVLTQLLKKFGANITATCYTRSIPVIKALGADDIISFNDKCVDDILNIKNNNENNYDIKIEPSEQLILFKELSLRPEYDVIFFTTDTNYDKGFIQTFLARKGVIIDTTDKPLRSDKYGIFLRLILSVYVKLKKMYSLLLKTPSNWRNGGESHICYSTLNKLADYVNDGIIQSVVDQVYTPQDAENAISHVCSSKSIGNTIITFR